MSTTFITLALPDSLKDFVEREVACGKHPDAAAYIRMLLREAQKRKAREEIEALLLEGIRSPAREMTKADWESIAAEGKPRVTLKKKR
jgi:antitoxin ParD1/3/4